MAKFLIKTTLKVHRIVEADPEAVADYTRRRNEVEAEFVSDMKTLAKTLTAVGKNTKFISEQFVSIDELPESEDGTKEVE